MKYDRNTMKSLQEAYESVSEDKFYSGKDRDPNTGLPKGLKPEKAKKIKTKKAKKPNYEGSTAGSDLKDIPEQQEHEGMKYSDKKKLQRQKQLADKQKEAPVVKNKIVPMKTRTEEAIKMSRKEYAIKEVHEITPEEEKRTHSDFINRKTKYIMIQNPETKGSKSVPYVVKNKKQKTDDAVKNESVEKNCGCGQTPCKTYGQKKAMDDKMKEVDDMRSLPTRMNLIKTKLRAMGLNMSHELKGKELSEVIDYTLVERTRYQKEKGIDKGGTKKPNFPKVSDPALDAVKAKYKGQIMTGHSRQPKKVPGEKTGGGGKYKAMADQKKQTAADAKKRGFDNVQNYVDTMARYGGKKNYDSGKGLGS